MSGRLISVLLLVTMTGARLMTAACEIVCLGTEPVSHAAEAAMARHACHESAPESPASPAHIAPRAHDGCHDAASAPFVLTSKSARTVLESVDLTGSTPQAFAARNVSAEGLFEPTLRDRPRTPTVTLRI